MPIVKVEQFPLDTKILIWHINEQAPFFSTKLASFYPVPIWSEFKDKRKMQWLGSRYLIQLGLSNEIQVNELTKDSFGCPQFQNHPLHCGISHTHQFVSVILSPQKVGCDIEIYQPEKIMKIAPKIIGDNEKMWVIGDQLPLKTQLVWGIKESAYKTWGQKNINWLSDIEISPLEWHPKSGSFTGKIGSKGNTKIDFYGEYTYHRDFLFVWTREIENNHE